MYSLDMDVVKAQIPELDNIVLLDKGGYKIVYKAEHAEHGVVVLKLIADPTNTERTLREIEVATQYTFDNVPSLYGSGILRIEGSDTLFLVEQFIDGTTLRRRLQRGSLPLSEVLTLLETLLKTEIEIGRYSLVHRDIKPENIMIDRAGKYWLLDFGIARHLDKDSLTATGDFFGLGTIGYAAPEQFRNRKPSIDVRADLFSIGVVAYEAIAGFNPFRQGAYDALDILSRTEKLQVPPLTIKGDRQQTLSGFINLLMSKYPTRRPRTAQEAYDWFMGLLPGLVVP